MIIKMALPSISETGKYGDTQERHLRWQQDGENMIDDILEMVNFNLRNPYIGNEGMPTGMSKEDVAIMGACFLAVFPYKGIPIIKKDEVLAVAIEIRDKIIMHGKLGAIGL